MLYSCLYFSVYIDRSLFTNTLVEHAYTEIHMRKTNTK